MLTSYPNCPKIRDPATGLDACAIALRNGVRCQREARLAPRRVDVKKNI